MVLSDEAKGAVKAFRDAKPWRGTFEERHEKFNTFATAFAEATGLECEFVFVGDETGRGQGFYSPNANKIVLSGKLSVVTLLFCFGLALGVNRTESLKWAKGVFKHYFPRSFAGCVEVSGLLKRREDMVEEQEEEGEEEE
jgi:hypothetical protein